MGLLLAATLTDGLRGGVTAISAGVLEEGY